MGFAGSNGFSTLHVTLRQPAGFCLFASLQHQSGSLRQRSKPQEWSIQSVSVKTPIHDITTLPKIQCLVITLQACSQDCKGPVLVSTLQTLLPDDIDKEGAPQALTAELCWAVKPVNHTTQSARLTDQSNLSSLGTTDPWILGCMLA